LTSGQRSIEPAPPVVELAKQTVLIGCAVLFYFAVRGQTEGAESTAIENGRWILDRESEIGIDVERTMQSWTESSGLTSVANWIYIWFHWPVIVGTLLWLHHSRIEMFLVLRNAIFVSGAIGLVIFVSLPVAPPRLIDAGFVDTVTEYSTSYRVLQPPALVNKYAAMPSLHVGWNLLIGIALLESSRRLPLRVFAVAGPVLMSVAVVVTANHYILDGIAGAGIALVGLWVSRRITMPLVRLDQRLHLLHPDASAPDTTTSSTP
jgi:membrane-associated phospholipid phosphatase